MSSLRNAVLDALRHGETERFTLNPSAGLDRALAAALAGPSPADELADVLRLIVALEQSLESPTAAEELRAWLRRSPGARGVLGQLFGAARGLDTQRAFAQMQGRQAGPRAGMYGSHAPEGAVSVRRWMDASVSASATDRARSGVARPATGPRLPRSA